MALRGVLYGVSGDTKTVREYNDIERRSSGPPMASFEFIEVVPIIAGSTSANIKYLQFIYGT